MIEVIQGVKKWGERSRQQVNSKYQNHLNHKENLSSFYLVLVVVLIEYSHPLSIHVSLNQMIGSLIDRDDHFQDVEEFLLIDTEVTQPKEEGLILNTERTLENESGMKIEEDEKDYEDRSLTRKMNQYDKEDY